MSETAERAVWLAARDTGVAHARMMRDTGSWVHAEHALVLPEQPALRAAWLNGYGHGISEGADRVPGHHLAGVAQPGKPVRVRTELVPDKRVTKCSPI